MGRPRECRKCKFKGDADHELFEDVKTGHLCNDCNKNFIKCSRCPYIGSHEDSEFLIADDKYGLTCKKCRLPKNKSGRERKKRKLEEDPSFRQHLNKLSNDLYKKNKDDPEFKKRRREYSQKYREQNPEYKSTNSHIISKYKSRAIKKKLEMSLSDNEIIDLTKGGHLCFYCNESDQRGYCGIDRINPNEGYTTQNSVSCCSVCNYMKNDMNHILFISHCGHIASYCGLSDAPFIYNSMENWSRDSYNKYLKRATSENIEFSLTNEDFVKIVCKVCYLCGRKNSKNHKNGIDRMENEKGYTTENARPCCARCNYIKRTYDLETILEKCVLIYENCKQNFDLYNDIDIKIKII